MTFVSKYKQTSLYRYFQFNIKKCFIENMVAQQIFCMSKNVISSYERCNDVTLAVYLCWHCTSMSTLKDLMKNFFSFPGEAIFSPHHQGENTAFFFFF